MFPILQEQPGEVLEVWKPLEFPGNSAHADFLTCMELGADPTGASLDPAGKTPFPSWKNPVLKWEKSHF